jgi:hypothetical protein
MKAAVTLAPSREKARWGVPVLIGATIAAAVGLSLWFQFGNLKHYGGAYLWPSLLANFAASLGAFVLALAWDRRLRAQEAVDEREELAQRSAEEQEEFARRHAEELKAEEDRRQTDARRLLDVVVKELEHDREVVRRLAPTTVEHAGLAYHIRTGAWASSADILGRLLSKSDLVAKTSGLYDQLSELEWRLRYIAERVGVASQLQVPDALKRAVNETDLFVRSIDESFDALLERLRQEAQDPAVDLLGIRREIVLDFIGSSTVVFGAEATGAQTGAQEPGSA